MWFLFFGQGSLAPHMTRYYDLDLHLGDWQIGILMAIPMIMVILSQPVWGYLADRRLGRSQTYRLCLLLTSASLLLFPFLYSLGGFSLLLFGAIFLSVGYVSMAGLSNSVMLSFLGPSERRKFGKIRWIGSLSFMTAAFFVVPPLVHLSQIWGFQGRVLVFLGSGFFFFLAILLSRWNENDFQPHRPPAHYSYHFLKDKNILIFYFVIFCGGASSSAVTLYLGPYIGHLGYSEKFFSALWLFGISCESLLGYNTDKIIDRIGIKNTVALGCLAEGIRWFLFLYIQSPVGILLVFLLHGPAVVGYFYASAMYLDTECEESIRSTAQTFLILAFFLGQVVAFLVASSIVGYHSGLGRAEAIQQSFYFYSAIGLLGALVGFLWIRKERSQDLVS